MTIIDEYLEYQEKFENKFGEKTIVLMEVGSFFEIYGVVNDTEKRGKIYEVADLTNLSISKKCSKTDPVSIKNPLMAGFPNHSVEKWKDILIIQLVNGKKFYLNMGTILSKLSKIVTEQKIQKEK